MFNPTYVNKVTVFAMTILSNNAYTKWWGEKTRGGEITFFTPTYNRSSFLNRIYDCLLAQTNKSFVWILVNDGSTDNTVEVAKKLMDKNDFPILFISKENGHKHSCFKVALENCQTEFFVCMDDDDIYKPNSVEFFLREWKIIKEDGIEDVGAIRTLTQKEDGTFLSNIPITDSEIGKRVDMSTLECNHVFGIIQENWTCYDTEKLKEIDLFPNDYWLHEKHRFFLESIWQGRFARKYKCRYINVALREYREDASTSILRSNKGYQHYLDMFINTFMIANEQYDYFGKNKREVFKMALFLQWLRYYVGINFLEMIRHTRHRGMNLALWSALPLSCLGKLVIKIRNRKKCCH